MYSPILGKGVFSGVFLYRRVNTCYRCYGHASPARKLSVPEKCVSAGSDAIRHTRGGRRTNAEETQCPPWTWSPRSEPEPSKRPVNDEWRSSRTKFSMSETKASQRGVYSVPGGKCEPWRLGSSAGSVGAPVMACPWAIGADELPCPERKPLNLQVPNPVEQWCAPSPLTETARNTCNTYSPAYKGKPRKKRLSPK